MSKKDLATQIFKSMAGASRSEVINAIVAKTGLSSNGAATYYNNIKNDKWGQTAPVKQKTSVPKSSPFAKLKVDPTNPFDLMVKVLCKEIG